MSAKLSRQAREWLKESHCFDEVADDYLSVANSNVLILLCERSVRDLNRQALEHDESNTGVLAPQDETKPHHTPMPGGSRGT